MLLNELAGHPYCTAAQSWFHLTPYPLLTHL